MNIFWKEMCMEKVRKKLIREKAVIAVYQYLLTNSTEEEIMNYLNECYKPRMDEREIELCKEIVFNTIERIDDLENGKSYVISKDGKPGPICTKLYNKLRGIQYGDEPDTHGWVTIVE